MVYVYIVLGGIAVVVIAVLARGFSRPASFRVERSTFINAPPPAIFDVLIDFRRFELWSPWEGKDLSMKKTFSGPATGTGAIYEWDGNKDIGSGRQEIVEAVPHSRIVMKLDFFRPFKGNNVVEFQLEPGKDSTNVRWIIKGPMHFMVRILGFDMDKMIGPDFETGLAKLKALCE